MLPAVATTSVIYDLIGRDNASRAFDSAGRSAGRLESGIARVGKAVAVAGAAIAAGAVAIGAESVKAAVDFQASMEKIHTQAGASQKSVDSLSKSVLDLGTYAEQSPQQLADALYHLKSVGLDDADAMKALKTASDLAAVGGANLEDTTNALAGAWRSGIKGAESFGKTASTVNAIIGAGNMRMEDFTAAIGTGILPAAKTFGVSLQSVGAALALMTDEGVPAEDAATRLRMSLSLLGAPSAAADKVLKSIGLSGLQLADAMRGPSGLIGAIALLKKHLDDSKLSASQQAAVLSTAFGGGRSSSAILTMVNNLDVLEKKQKQINDTTGNYGAAVQAQRKTAQAQFALLKSDLDVLGVRIGSALLPPVTKFVGWLASTGVPGVEKFAGKVMAMLPVKTIENDAKKIIDVIRNFFGIGKQKPAITVPWKLEQRQEKVTFASLATAPVKIPWTLEQRQEKTSLAPAAGSAKPAADSLTSLIKPVTDSLTAALKKINWGSVLATAVRGAVSGAAAIGAAFGDLLGKINWISVGKGAATAMVGLAIGLVNNLIPALMDAVIHHPLDMVMFLGSLIPVGRAAGIIVKIFGKIPLLGPLLRFLLGPLEKAGSAMESLLGKILGKVFGPVGRLIGGYFAKARGWLVSKGEDILLGLWYGAEGAWRTVSGWLAKIGGFVLAPFRAAGRWLAAAGGNIIGGLWNGAKAGWRLYWTWFIRIQGAILGYFARAGSWLLARGSALFGGLLSGAARGWRTVGGWLAGTGGRIVSYFARAGRWLLGAGSNIIHGLLNGIAGAFRGIGGWIKRVIVDPLVNWVKHWFGIRSPSTVMAGIGGHLISGLLKGLMSTGAEQIALKVFGSLPQALAGIVSKGLVAIARLPGKALSALRSLGGAVLGGAKSIWHALFGGGGGGDTGAHGAAAAFAQNVARTLIGAYGWGGGQMDPLLKLWNQESGWNAYAVNPTSGAAGIPQNIQGWAAYAPGDVFSQILWGLNYIKGRYGSPGAAWAHEQAFNWYGYGGTFAAGQLIGVGDRGPELAMFGQAGRVFSPEQSAALVAGAQGGGNTYNITVNVPPTASKADTGRAVVECIREYERGSGTGWRKR